MSGGRPGLRPVRERFLAGIRAGLGTEEAARAAARGRRTPGPAEGPGIRRVPGVWVHGRGPVPPADGFRPGQPVSSGSSYQVTFSPTRARIFHLTDFGAASIACRSRSALDATACA
jgi:hypothetical protein